MTTSTTSTTLETSRENLFYPKPPIRLLDDIYNASKQYIQDAIESLTKQVIDASKESSKNEEIQEVKE